MVATNLTASSRSLKPWECVDVHQCPTCEPELAHPVASLGEGHILARGHHPPCGPGCRHDRLGNVAPIWRELHVTLDGVVVPYQLEMLAGAHGWVDAATQTVGSTGVAGLHICPCGGFQQCRRRLYGRVEVRGIVHDDKEVAWGEGRD